MLKSQMQDTLSYDECRAPRSPLWEGCVGSLADLEAVFGQSASAGSGYQQ